MASINNTHLYQSKQSDSDRPKSPCRRQTPYVPFLKDITGSIEGALLLRQLIYWWDKNKRKVFYKYLRPVIRNTGDDSPIPQGYKEDDTLAYEMGFNRSQLDRALKATCQRVRRGDRKQLETALCFRWLKHSKFFFEVNEPVIFKKLIEIYPLAANAISAKYCISDTLKFILNTENRADLDGSPKTPGESIKTMPYPDYLQSDHWQQIRERKLEQALFKCQLCNSGDNLNVHHRTYERRGEEWDQDLTVLCKECHARYHMIKER